MINTRGNFTIYNRKPSGTRSNPCFLCWCRKKLFFNLSFSIQLLFTCYKLFTINFQKLRSKSFRQKLEPWNSVVLYLIKNWISIEAVDLEPLVLSSPPKRMYGRYHSTYNGNTALSRSLHHYNRFLITGHPHFPQLCSTRVEEHSRPSTGQQKDCVCEVIEMLIFTIWNSYYFKGF